MKLVCNDFTWDGASFRLQKKAIQIFWDFQTDYKIFEGIFSILQQ